MTPPSVGECRPELHRLAGVHKLLTPPASLSSIACVSLSTPLHSLKVAGICGSTLPAQSAMDALARALPSFMTPHG